MEQKTTTQADVTTTSIIEAAILAPSAHNTQPWKFRTTDHTIDVYVDWSRHLEVSDQTHRQLYVSLGCATTNLRLAAQHASFSTHVDYFPEGQDKDQPAARINLESAMPSPNSNGTLYQAIQDRRTDRSLYDAEPLTDQELTKIKTHQDPDVIWVTDRNQIDQLATLTAQATKQTLSRQDFKQELSHWVRNNWTRQPDGMPGYAMGMPAPVSLLSSVMVRLAPIHKQEAPKNKQQMNSASAVATVATDTDQPTDWLTAGRLLQRLWLEATAAGLGACPHAAAIEAGDDIRQQVQQALNTTKLPQAILRVGHSKATNLRATPRRTVEDVTNL